MYLQEQNGEEMWHQGNSCSVLTWKMDSALLNV